jgi:hypothetical protein
VERRGFGGFVDGDRDGAADGDGAASSGSWAAVGDGEGDGVGVGDGATAWTSFAVTPDREGEGEDRLA